MSGFLDKAVSVTKMASPMLGSKNYTFAGLVNSKTSTSTSSTPKGRKSEVHALTSASYKKINSSKVTIRPKHEHEHEHVVALPPAKQEEESIKEQFLKE